MVALYNATCKNIFLIRHRCVELKGPKCNVKLNSKLLGGDLQLILAIIKNLWPKYRFFLLEKALVLLQRKCDTPYLTNVQGRFDLTDYLNIVNLFHPQNFVTYRRTFGQYHELVSHIGPGQVKSDLVINLWMLHLCVLPLLVFVTDNLKIVLTVNFFDTYVNQSVEGVFLHQKDLKCFEEHHDKE